MVVGAILQIGIELIIFEPVKVLFDDKPGKLVSTYDLFTIWADVVGTCVHIGKLWNVFTPIQLLFKLNKSDDVDDDVVEDELAIM